MFQESESSILVAASLDIFQILSGVKKEFFEQGLAK